jgi:lipopolysaccharide/colanic/teichoic acid biosynthesis glycosyltransferase
MIKTYGAVNTIRDWIFVQKILRFLRGTQATTAEERKAFGVRHHHTKFAKCDTLDVVSQVHNEGIMVAGKWFRSSPLLELPKPWNRLQGPS